MKSMMGIKRSSTPSVRALKRATGRVGKNTTGKISMPKVSGAFKRVAAPMPMMQKKVAFGEKTFGPKKMLGEMGKPTMPNTQTAQTTPAVAAPAAPAPKLSSKALKRAAKAAKAAAPSKK